MSRERYSATPSSYDNDSPASTFSRIGCRFGSITEISADIVAKVYGRRRSGPIVSNELKDEPPRAQRTTRSVGPVSTWCTWRSSWLICSNDPLQMGQQRMEHAVSR